MSDREEVQDDQSLDLDGQLRFDGTEASRPTKPRRRRDQPKGRPPRRHRIFNLRGWGADSEVLKDDRFIEKPEA